MGIKDNVKIIFFLVSYNYSEDVSIEVKIKSLLQHRGQFPKWDADSEGIKINN